MLAALALGCGGSGGEAGPRTQGNAHVGGDVVSTVDGAPITLSDVQALTKASGLTPREALSRLQTEALLAGEASRRGYQVDPDVVRVAHQGRAQALLAERIESVHATDAEISAEYEKQQARFHQPERRGSVHVLARLGELPTPEQERAAKELAQLAVEELASNPKRGEVLARFRAMSSPDHPLVAEKLPEVERGGDFVTEFLDALFAQPAVGVVPQPVRTKFGFHAILITSIVPAVEKSLADATPELRKEIEVAKRRAALEKLLAALRQDNPVVEHETARESMASLEL